MATQEQIKSELAKSEADLAELKELLAEEPDNTDLILLQNEFESTIAALKSQLVTPTEEGEPTYNVRDQVLAYSDRDKGWFAAQVTHVLSDGKYWVKFGPREDRLVTKDQIKPFGQIDHVKLSTVKNRNVRKIPDNIPDELPRWTKPKPNDTPKELMIKKKKRHALKSLIKSVWQRLTRRRKQEEEVLIEQKNTWRAFARTLKKPSI